MLEERPVDGPQPGRLVDVLEAPGRGTPAVDDEEVEPAERADGRIDRSGRAVRRREVRPDREPAEALGLGVQARTGPGDDRDAGAFGRQRLRDRSAEAATAAPDEGSRAGQSKVHGAHGRAPGVGCGDVRS